MKFSLAAAAISTTALTTAQNVTRSAPFNLVLQSSNATINNAKLGACHSGAALEALCYLPNINNGVFHFNQTDSQFAPLPSDSAPGLLTWTLQVQGGPSPDQAMSLFTPESTNVGQAMFSFQEGTQVSFDKNDKLNIITYYDDTKTPPTSDSATALYRWFLCPTNYAGYQYQTLNWVYGSGKPQNKACQAVGVKRVFIK